MLSLEYLRKCWAWQYLSPTGPFQQKDCVLSTFTWTKKVIPSNYNTLVLDQKLAFVLDQERGYVLEQKAIIPCSELALRILLESHWDTMKYWTWTYYIDQSWYRHCLLCCQCINFSKFKLVAICNFFRFYWVTNSHCKKILCQTIHIIKHHHDNNINQSIIAN